MKPQLLVDAEAELLFLGCCMRTPALLEHPDVSAALFVAHRPLYRALATAHTAGLLGGDLPTAAAALEAADIPNPKSTAATAMLNAEDAMEAPVRRHLKRTATQRTADRLATAIRQTSADPSTHDADRETFGTLGAQVADLGLNGDRPPPYTRFTGLVPERIYWLWHRRIPLGKLTLLDGDPGLGKTALTLDLAARLSAGAPLEADGRIGPPIGVVLVNAEDGLTDTLLPRLLAAGANFEHIVAFDLDHIPMLPSGLPLIRQAIQDTAASLVVIDPVMAVLSAACDAYRDQDVRLVLRPLAALAQETGVAILLVRHLTKSPGPKALYRGGGSIAFNAAARSALLVGPDPDNPDDRILAAVKSNLCPKPPALRFGFDATPDDSSPLRIAWKGTADTTADQLVNPPGPDDDPSAVSEAVEVLRQLLRDGPVAAGLATKAQREASISDYAWKAARRHLHVRTDKESFSKGWVLSLPP